MTINLLIEDRFVNPKIFGLLTLLGFLVVDSNFHQSGTVSIAPAAKSEISILLRHMRFNFPAMSFQILYNGLK